MQFYYYVLNEVIARLLTSTVARKDVFVKMAFACRDMHNADCGISRSSNDKEETILAATVATPECYLHPGRGHGVG